MMMTIRGISLPMLVLFAGLALTPTAHAQTSDPALREEVEALKKGQEQIRKDLAEIKKLLQARAQPQRPAAPDVSGKIFDLGDNPVVGESTAKLTLVEFTDYQ
jgi:protein-disulfide isomerase